MKLPGDPDYPGMEYALAVAARGKHKVVSLVTSWETKENVRDAAVRLARESAVDPAALIARHEEGWARYWSASGVELDDPEFQLWWYRMVVLPAMFCQAGRDRWACLPGWPPTICLGTVITTTITIRGSRIGRRWSPTTPSWPIRGCVT